MPETKQIRYVVYVEIEILTERDPIEYIKHALERNDYAEHYHILGKAKEI